MAWVIATDIGGTFTDLVAYETEAGEVRHAKSHTEPENLSAGILRCIHKAELPLARATDFVHGSTVAINTAIERKGARTALLVTKGTRDLYAIGRGNRPEAYNLFFKRPDPLVPRSRTFEVDERIGARGVVVEPIDEESVARAFAAAHAEGAEAIAVCFLHSYANPAHEQAVASVAARSDVDAYLCLSHELLREYREYERISTTVLNAYIGPRVSEYLTDLERGLREEGFVGRLTIMQSNGGVMAPATARREPVRAMESGPVGGAIASARLAHRLGIDHAVVFDMGGTTAKASLVNDGVPEMADGYFVGDSMSGHPVMLPVVDVIEVGAGGGSIAHIDDVGALQVGPESAGGYPGPICYGWGGTEPTVTDANAVLGRLDPGQFLGGEMPLDVAAARLAIEERVARPLGLDVTAAAQAIVDIAVNRMALAVRAVSIERGFDPRDCTLVASGGAGPLHAVQVARELDIPSVVVPVLPGHYSAFGMLVSDVRHDYVRTCFVRLGDADLIEIADMADDMGREACALMEEEGIDPAETRTEILFDLRYVGQEFTLRVPVGREEIHPDEIAKVRSRFDLQHDARYAHSAPHEEVEIVNVRVVGYGRRRSADISVHLEDATSGDPVGARTVGYPTKNGCVEKEATVWRRERLAPGTHIAGPAVIEEYASTFLLDEGDALTVSDQGELIATVAHLDRTIEMDGGDDGATS